MSPRRIQRQRTKGWRMPEGAVYVGRPTKWGDPFRLRTPYALARVPAVAHEGKPWEYEGRISADGARHDYHHSNGRVTVCHVRYMTAAEAVQCYRQYITGGGWPLDFLSRASRDLDVTELRGKDLACWCPLDQPCHADVLLELANADRLARQETRRLTTLPLIVDSATTCSTCCDLGRACPKHGGNQ